MAYSSFTLSKVKASFGIQTNETSDLFVDVEPVPPSNLLSLLLKDQLPVAGAINTEKARSELIIMPVLMEVRRILSNQVAIFSGSSFEVEPAQGLEGRCDFLLSRSAEQYYIASPVFAIVEAKNESIPSGLGQCAATMIAARMFNQRSLEIIEPANKPEQTAEQTIYGAVTTGTDWKFLKLVNQTIFIDVSNYYIKEVAKILGILLSSF